MGRKVILYNLHDRLKIYKIGNLRPWKAEIVTREDIIHVGFFDTQQEALKKGLIAFRFTHMTIPRD